MTKTSLIPALILALAACGPAIAEEPSESLVGALSDQDPDIRALAASLLAEESEAPGGEAPEALIARAADRSENWRVRVAAAEALASRANEDSSLTGRLVDLVLDGREDWRVRAAAHQAVRLRDGDLQLAAALARTGEVRISNGTSSVSLTEPLADGGILDALADPDPRMRKLARAALDGGLDMASTVPAPRESETPCFTTMLQGLLGRAHAATGTLVY